MSTRIYCPPSISIWPTRGQLLNLLLQHQVTRQLTSTCFSSPALSSASLAVLTPSFNFLELLRSTAALASNSTNSASVLHLRLARLCVLFRRFRRLHRLLLAQLRLLLLLLLTVGSSAELDAPHVLLFGIDLLEQMCGFANLVARRKSMWNLPFFGTARGGASSCLRMASEVSGMNG